MGRKAKSLILVSEEFWNTVVNGDEVQVATQDGHTYTGVLNDIKERAFTLLWTDLGHISLTKKDIKSGIKIAAKGAFTPPTRFESDDAG